MEQTLKQREFDIFQHYDEDRQELYRKVESLEKEILEYRDLNVVNEYGIVVAHENTINIEEHDAKEGKAPLS